MTRISRLLALCSLALAAMTTAAATPYFPPAGHWDARPPEALGFDAARLAEAVAFATQHETRLPRDLSVAIPLSFSREPFDTPIGPTQPRGGPAGLVIRHGYVAARWGDLERVDMTFSVAKSFLSTVVGIGVARGKIGSVDERVSARLGLPEFTGEPNAAITWDQLLRQTSNWRGTLWGKPDWADRPQGDDPLAWPDAPVPPPGTSWKYNDVRVNALALAALHAWGEPLPGVLKREVMDPIGASATWRWEGYENSWLTLDGRRMQSVSGGGHWGGGMFISAWDLARFGMLCLHRGQWDGREIYPVSWFDYARRPTPQNPQYGVMNWFLNTDRTLLPSAPVEAITHFGMGTNMVYVDPVHDLVVVARWIERGQVDAFLGRVLAALAEGSDR
jgi:CubicO group peptidase (beta-lactamase class C family)